MTDLIDLIKSEKLTQQRNYADAQIQRVEQSRQPLYRYQGRDAESGSTIVSSGAGTLTGKSITNGWIKPNQPIQISQDGSAIAINSMPRPLMNPAIETPPQPNGKIKVLFSVIEGGNRVFYVGGDRTVPKKIYSIAANEIVDIAQISNVGENRFYVQLRHYNSLSVLTKITISNNQKWIVPITPLSPAGLFYGELVSGGNGFWTQSIITSASSGLTSVIDSVTSRSQFLGRLREITGGTYTYDQSSGTEISLVTSAISPFINKESQHFSNTIVNSNQYNQLIILGKNALSCMYFFVDSEVLLESGTPTSFNYQLKLTNRSGSQETVLGGDLGFRRSLGGSVYAYPANLLNLIGSQLYMLNLGITIDPFNFATLAIPESVWKPTQSKNLAVDVYILGADTTKRSTISKVFAIKPNAQIHSLSYHP